MKKKGFTLAEMIVVSAILLILISMGYDFLINNYKFLEREKNKTYIETQVKSFLDFVNFSLQNAFQSDKAIKVINGVEKEIDEKKINVDELYIVVPQNNNIVYYDETVPDEEQGNVYEIYSYNRTLFIEKNGQIRRLLEGRVENLQISKNNSFIHLKLVVDFKSNGVIREYTVNYNIRQ